MRRTVNKLGYVRKDTGTFVGAYKKKQKLASRGSLKPCIDFTTKPIDEKNNEEVYRRLYQSSSQIASKIVNIIEYIYVFSSGDIFTLIKNKGVGFISNSITKEIEKGDFYDRIKNEYNLNNNEISLIKSLVKKTIETLIEYVVNEIVNYIEIKKLNLEIKKFFINELRKDIDKNIKQIGIKKQDYRIYKDYINTEIRIIPYQIKAEIKKTIAHRNFENNDTYNLIKKTIEQFIKKYYQKSLSQNIICEDTAKAYLFNDLINLKLKDFTILTEFKSNLKYCRYDIAIINKKNLEKYNDSKIELNQIIPELIIELKHYLNLNNKINLKRIEEELLTIKNKSNAKIKYFIYLDETIDYKNKKKLYELKYKIKEENNFKIYLPE